MKGFDLGKSIKIRRIRVGLRQKDIAKKLGITTNYVSLLENNRKNPSLGILVRLAKVLSIPLGLLFIDSEKNLCLTRDEKADLLCDLRR